MRGAILHNYAQTSHLRVLMHTSPMRPSAGYHTRHSDDKNSKVLTCHIAKKIRDTQRTRDSM